MKVVILAGGVGSRLQEETVSRPKPMIEIGNRPILWHIMKLYAAHGLHEFVICLGYKGHVIKSYFANYLLHCSDVTIDIYHNQLEIHNKHLEPWRVTLVETGDSTSTGGRIKQAARYVEREPFCLTYGDGVADINISALLAFHAEQGRYATVTAVRPPARFGALKIDNQRVSAFQEKPAEESGWINGGFFVFAPSALEYIDGDEPLEGTPLERLADDNQLMAFQHDGFWQPMDTLRDKQYLEALWATGEAPWKRW